MKYRVILLFLILNPIVKACNAQKVGGPCEGCEAVYEYGNISLTNTVTLPKYGESDPKIKLTGVVYHQDGKTPAANVILYFYHTNRKGIYEKKGDEKGLGQRHGYIRGWIKTNHDGTYTVHTFRPGAYPDRGAPEHIHITVKEPNVNEYYIDDVLFNDDPLLTKKERDARLNRAGNGITQPKLENGLLMIRRDIILGLNIPNY